YGPYILYYNTTSSSVGNGTFTARDPYSYMVFWKNLSNTTRVNLTYSFVLLSSQPSLWPLYVVPVGIGLVAAAAVATHVRVQRGRDPGDLGSRAAFVPGAGLHVDAAPPHDLRAVLRLDDVRGDRVPILCFEESATLHPR